MAWVCMTESVLPSTALLSCAFVLFCAHAMLRCCAAVLQGRMLRMAWVR